MGCAKHISVADPFLEPTRIEGKHASLTEVMQDPNSETYDLYLFGGQAEDAVLRCNADKASVKTLQGTP